MSEFQLKPWLKSTLDQSPHFQALCQPLMDKLPISFIRLTRIFKNNTLAILTTRPDALEWYFCEKKYLLGMNEQSYEFYNSGFALSDSWPSAPEKINQLLQPLRDDFNIASELVFYYKKNDYVDIFEIALGRGHHQVNNLLMKHFRQIDQYVQHQLLVHPLIQKHCVENQIALPSEQKPTYLLKDGLIPQEDQQVASLTTRELESLFWLHQGKSVPEIAQILQISPRTTEKYVQQLKMKLQVYSPFQLGYLVGRYKEYFEPLFHEIKEN
ncbi:helix-turn-helix transcriptional regulator [Legionella shakespearei]|uniref:Response regulator containing a CheY-like receiver domain and an HTH DNA-binding domain protein n=1 Tax=Legionella shakespearei DSM 23087 TaxID=1122169 RepID=A0A0W0Z8M3_9GAMM|nr:helix-turn-helix transcriptional regulator [Legionella shakespearei]KTD65447.1 Response regulator containing a CheY-like receiver domain and an HTH DNA-binding domain protein [Legionella shakespearei DSM 23087]